MSDPGIGANLREIRERRGLTRQQLADRSGVALPTIQALEQHPERGARMDTLRRLANAMGVRTSDLLRTRRPEIVVDDSQHASLLLALRGVLAPLPRLPGAVLEYADEPPSVNRLNAAVKEAIRAHRADSYDLLLPNLPGLIADARLLVRSTGGREHEAASTALSTVLRITGMTLRQLREYDLAVVAHSEAIEAATRVGDLVATAYAVSKLSDVYMCQGRLGDAADLCTSAAESLRGESSPVTVAARGSLLTTGAAAAVRDGRETGEMLDEAASTTSRLPTQDESVVRVAAIRGECAMIEDRPDEVLALTREIPRTTAVWTHPHMVRRHRLDVAHAHLRLGAPKRAAEIITDVGEDAPTWLARQNYGREIVSELLEGHRRLSPELARAADLVGVPV